MSSQTVQQIKAHFLTTKQYNDKPSPAANELWFAKLPHWLNYCPSSCLGITTQPTASGDEINFYAGAAFVVHLGKYADGTNKNQIVYIDSDKYLTVSESGSYCFDENGNIVTGTITYNSATNKVSVDGVEGNYTQKVQDFTYSGGSVTLGNPIEVMNIGGGSAELVQSGSQWAFKFGNNVLQCCSGQLSYGESTKTIYMPVPMKNTTYSATLVYGGYYTLTIQSKTTTSITVSVPEAWETINFTLFIGGEC